VIETSTKKEVGQCPKFEIMTTGICYGDAVFCEVETEFIKYYRYFSFTRM
jgi:hypothetical protein